MSRVINGIWALMHRWRKRLSARPARIREKLVFEITESIFLDSSAEAVSWLNQFKALGSQLAIDDFGTGYSSLSYLKQFPIDKLKIDRTFVRDLPDNKEDASLVSAIIAMSQSLNLELIAEGVETIEQLRFLHKLKCANIQGFLLSKTGNRRTVTRRYQTDRVLISTIKPQ